VTGSHREGINPGKEQDAHTPIRRGIKRLVQKTGKPKTQRRAAREENKKKVKMFFRETLPNGGPEVAEKRAEAQQTEPTAAQNQRQPENTSQGAKQRKETKAESTRNQRKNNGKNGKWISRDNNGRRAGKKEAETGVEHTTLNPALREGQS